MSKVSCVAARKHCKCLCEWRGELERVDKIEIIC